MALAPFIRPALAGLVSLLAFAAAPAHAALPQLGGSVDLANPQPNPVLDGAAASDATGQAVARAGDVNGDGLEDMIVGAPSADPNGRRDAGTAYVVFGRSDGGGVDLARIGQGGGFRIDGAVASDHMGWSVAPAGDVNGDGLADVIVGAKDADNRGRSNSGSAYVVYGRAASTPVDAAALGSQGFRIDGGAAGDRLGTYVSGGRDVNGDGHPDVAVGAPQADHNGRTNSGTVYVVWGAAAQAGVDTAALGSGGLAIDGAALSDQLGPVALTRDLNGDGRADVLAGAPFADPAGRLDAGAAYVVAGTASVDLGTPGAAIYVANGASAGDWAGSTVAQGGDLDGDGGGDLLVGAPGAGYNARAGAGSAYVILGARGGGVHDLGSLDSTWRIDGAGAGEAAGTALDAGADLNSDGRADLVVGSPYADPIGRTDAGSARVLFGGGFAGVVDLASPPPGFRVDGGAAGDRAGIAAAIAPDTNGDGRGDLLVGAQRTDHLGRSNAGSAYVLLGFGQSALGYPGGTATTVGQPITPLGPEAVVRTGTASFSISPPLPPGLTLDTATGVIAGAPTEIQEQPAAYTLTMTDFTGSVSVPILLRVAPLPGRCANLRVGTDASDRISGTTGGDRITGGSGGDSIDGLGGDDCAFGDDDGDHLAGDDGNDELHGGKGQDVIDGDAGDDQLFGDMGQDIVNGESGNDILRGGPGLDEMQGGDGNDRLFGETDSDVLDGGAGNDLIDGGAKADKLTGGKGNDRIFGGDGNDIIIDRSGSNRIDAGTGNDTIDVLGGKRDLVKCGKGNDRVTADRIDKLSGCEKVKRVGKAKKKAKRRHRR